MEGCLFNSTQPIVRKCHTHFVPRNTSTHNLAITRDKSDARSFFIVLQDKKSRSYCRESKVKVKGNYSLVLWKNPRDNRAKQQEKKWIHLENDVIKDNDRIHLKPALTGAEGSSHLSSIYGSLAELVCQKSFELIRSNLPPVIHSSKLIINFFNA